MELLDFMGFFFYTKKDLLYFYYLGVEERENDIRVSVGDNEKNGR